ncbi:SgcJ/EcaC family oxidoreductase [Saccharothrix variisporea]|uniref:Uncharacterized protein (TIGR02246 family) n=1 Tax=Saccharothrix variisporea TaxID=543527 RepID=A0A495X434_9PSEU|nr:SgcJ/EcaC family oxidoreductase [Saccharothrix variisporea]RKT68005.1 uncharacterized protein (TIGR02246 family) [Saccharothrix variisporea]
MAEHTAEAAIADLGRELVEAWNRGDAAAYAALFTEDADYVVFNGTHLRGRAEIEKAHRWLFDGPLKGSRLGAGSAPAASPRFVRPDVAIAVTGGGVVGEGQAEVGPEQDSVQTVVVVDDGDRWRYASFQNTRKS